LAALEHAVELEHYVKQLSQALGVQPEVIKQDLERSRKQLEMNQNSSDARKNQSVRSTHEPIETESEKTTQTTKEANKKLTRQERLEKFGLFLLFQSEGEQFFKRATQLNEMPLVTVGAHQVLAAIIKIGENASLQSLRQSLPEDLQQKVFSWYADQQFVENADQLDLPTEWQRVIKDLKTEASKSRRQGIATRLSELDRNPNKSDTELSEQDTLLKELAMLNSSSRVK
jgi:hypothetical protein